MAPHVMTARRKAALRKAQLASARKRRKGTGFRARRNANKIKKTQAGIKRGNKALKRLPADLRGTGFEHSIQRRQARRHAKVTRLKAKASRKNWGI